MTSFRSGEAQIETRFISSLSELSADQWNALASDTNPFMRHEFLSGLEQHVPLAEHGWYPQHLLLFEDQRPVAAMPLYLKSNSWGEFVFDWAWAEAYERSVGPYYPKLVSAVPFTPVTGPRLLQQAGPVSERRAAIILEAIQAYVEQRNLSSFHCLFPADQELNRYTDAGLLIRQGCQYHWVNQGYADFQEFLSTLSAKKRKRIRRERREVEQAGVEFQVYSGHQISDELWGLCHQLYCSTFHYKGNTPRLTLEFFKHLGDKMPAETLIFTASLNQKIIAMAFAMRDENTLYGRHWGCNLELRHLHFELCYYQTIDYCITNGLQCLNAGAQGEHKVGRGFSPVKTASAHYIPDESFAIAVRDYLRRETGAIDRYVDELDAHSAYRQTDVQI